MNAVLDNFDLVLRAFGYTVFLFLVSAVLSLALGTVLAAMRVGPVSVLRGFGTAYEGLIRADVSGRDSLAVVGLGPVGLAAGLLGGKLGAVPRVGVDPSPERRALALELGAVDASVLCEGVSCSV